MENVKSSNDTFDLIFAAVDTNKNGLIEENELREVVTRLKLPENLVQPGVQLTKEQFRQMFGQYADKMIGSEDVPFEDMLDKRSGKPMSMAEILGVEVDLSNSVKAVQQLNYGQQPIALTSLSVP